MLHNGHWTHPELWMMWFAVIGTAVNSWLLLWVIIMGFLKEKK